MDPNNQVFTAAVTTCDYGVHRMNQEPVLIDITTEVSFLNIGSPNMKPSIVLTEEDPSCNVIIVYVTSMLDALSFYAFNVCTG